MEEDIIKQTSILDESSEIPAPKRKNNITPYTNTDQDFIERERQYLVAKSNSLIQYSRYDLSVVEQKIILSLIQQIRREDTEFREYEFRIRDFCKLCGLEPDSGKSYNKIKQCIKTLADKSVYVTLPGTETETLIRWIQKPYFEKRSGTIRIQLDTDMKPYLLQLKERFTQFSLFYCLPMKSKYSIRLYEMLKSYAGLHSQITKSLADLRSQLVDFSANDPKATKRILYPKWSDFNRFCLTPAITEINAYTDISVSFEVKKFRREVTHVIFTISPVDKDERENRIMAVEKRLDGKDIAKGLKIAQSVAVETPADIDEQIEKDPFVNVASTIPYYCGAHKKTMKAALMIRMNFGDISASLISGREKEVFAQLIDTLVSFGCSHTKIDVLVDGGNKGNIIRINRIIEQYKNLDKWFLAAIDKYSDTHLWESKQIKNPAAYWKRCVMQDLVDYDILIKNWEKKKNKPKAKFDIFATYRDNKNSELGVGNINKHGNGCF